MTQLGLKTMGFLKVRKSKNSSKKKTYKSFLISALAFKKEPNLNNKGAFMSNWVNNRVHFY